MQEYSADGSDLPEQANSSKSIRFHPSESPPSEILQAIISGNSSLPEGARCLAAQGLDPRDLARLYAASSPSPLDDQATSHGKDPRHRNSGQILAEQTPAGSGNWNPTQAGQGGEFLVPLSHWLSGSLPEETQLASARLIWLDQLDELSAALEEKDWPLLDADLEDLLIDTRSHQLYWPDLTLRIAQSIEALAGKPCSELVQEQLPQILERASVPAANRQSGILALRTTLEQVSGGHSEAAPDAVCKDSGGQPHAEDSVHPHREVPSSLIPNHLRKQRAPSRFLRLEHVRRVTAFSAAVTLLGCGIAWLVWPSASTQRVTRLLQNEKGINDSSGPAVDADGSANGLPVTIMANESPANSMANRDTITDREPALRTFAPNLDTMAKPTLGLTEYDPAELLHGELPQLDWNLSDRMTQSNEARSEEASGSLEIPENAKGHAPGNAMGVPSTEPQGTNLADNRKEGADVHADDTQPTSDAADQHEILAIPRDQLLSAFQLQFTLQQPDNPDANGNAPRPAASEFEPLTAAWVVAPDATLKRSDRGLLELRHEGESPVRLRIRIQIRTHDQVEIRRFTTATLDPSMGFQPITLQQVDEQLERTLRTTTQVSQWLAAMDVAYERTLDDELRSAYRQRIRFLEQQRDFAIAYQSRLAELAVLLRQAETALTFQLAPAE